MPHYDKYYPNYLRKYPEIENRPDVLLELRRSDRKMKYIEADLKEEAFIEDQQKRIARFIPSREDSYERLLEEERQQFSDGSDMEELVLLREDILRLRRALLLLEEEEAELIKALYFRGLSERDYGKSIGISQKGVNKRRKRVLNKLYKIITETKKF